MSRRDDLDLLYIWPSRIEYFMRWLFWINVLGSFISYIVETETFNIVLVVQIIVSIFYVVLSILDDNLFWYNAECARRKTNIENGFGIDITEYKTEEYYNNTLPNNVIKYSVNAFESILFSKTTARLMILRKAANTGIAIIVFIIACLVYKDYSVILIISQTVFSTYYIIEFVKLTVFKFRLESLYDAFYKELITLGIKNKNQRSLLLTYTIEYEAIKAHYKVRLSSKLFWKHKDDTGLKWQQICNKIKIN